MRKGKAHIGTSGWHYKHWIGTFYPEGTKDAEQMAYYLKFFKTVELNNSFYMLPAKKLLKTGRKPFPPVSSSPLKQAGISPTTKS